MLRPLVRGLFWSVFDSSAELSGTYAKTLSNDPRPSPALPSADYTRLGTSLPRPTPARRGTAEAANPFPAGRPDLAGTVSRPLRPPPGVRSQRPREPSWASTFSPRRRGETLPADDGNSSGLHACGAGDKRRAAANRHPHGTAAPASLRPPAPAAPAPAMSRPLLLAPATSAPIGSARFPAAGASPAARGPPRDGAGSGGSRPGESGLPAPPTTYRRLWEPAFPPPSP